MCAAPGRVEPELVGLPGKTLTQDSRRRLRFVVHAAGWLHSMAHNGHRCVQVRTEFGVRFLVTGACQNSQVNFSLLSICNRHSVRLLFWRLVKLLLFMQP